MKKRLLALLLSLVMLLTCMGAGLEAAIGNDDGSGSAEQTVTTEPVESTETPDGEDTTPTDGETPSGEPATDDDTTETPEETAAPTEAPTEDETKEPAGGEDSAPVDGEDKDTAPDDEEAVDEDAGVDEDSDAEEDTDTDSEPEYPLVSFTNVAPFLEPVTGTGSTSAIGQAFDKIAGVVTGIIDRLTGGDASVQTVDDDTSGSDTGDGTKTSGLNVNKTATYNDDGSYTITLEAYATGEKTISTVTKDVPTDIVLVLDLSSSMDKDIGTVSYSAYYNKNNEALYALRHNGGDSNLWYEVDGKYYSVSVTATGRVPSTTDVTNNANKDLIEKEIYVLVDGQYVKVTVTKNDRTYTYKLSDGTVIAESKKGNKAPGTIAHTDDGKLYTINNVETSNAVYTYSCVVNGETKTITTSNAGSTIPDGTFYSRTTSTSGGGSRLQALKDACTNFVTSVASKCTTADGKTVDHRIAVVGFNSESTRYTGTSNKTALIDMSTAKGKAAVEKVITDLGTSQGTVPAAGLSTANSIFDDNPISDGESRNRVVVFFTDGYPSTSGADYFDDTLANNAITQAETAKNTYGATVYSIAVISGADPTSAGKKDGTNQEKVNWYLHNVSSNNGTPQSPGYYLSAADADSLNSIFKQISENIDNVKTSTTLDFNAVVKDVISDQFMLPTGTTASDITIETYACTGKDGDTYEWSETSSGNGNASATVNGNQVSVTGFNFSENWCGTEPDAQGKITAHGSKLVISFRVQPKAGFLGGNDVYTNSSAGVYASIDAEEATVTFPEPTVNVPIKGVTVTAADKNVYLLGSVTGEQLKNDATVTVGGVNGVTLDLSKDNYGLKDWQTKYVEITVTVTGKDGKAITTLSDLKVDAEYTVTVSVSPKATGTDTDKKGPAATEQKGSKVANINVFKPVLTFKDSTAYYGDTAPNDFSDNLTTTEWKHGDTKSTDSGVTMIGTVPTIDLTYTPETVKIADSKINTKEDIDVDVTVKINETDVSTHTTFEHQNCAETSCTWTTPSAKGDPAFLIHVKTCTLNITKTGGANDESYVFYVYKDNEKYTEVAIWGNDTETIYELPVGKYTITEDTGWSWRYGKSDSSRPSYNPADGVTLSADTPTGTITCANSSPFAYWLNGFSTIVRNIIEAVTT